MVCSGKVNQRSSGALGGNSRSVKLMRQPVRCCVSASLYDCRAISSVPGSNTSSVMSSTASGARPNTPEPLPRSMADFNPCAPLLWWWLMTTVQPRFTQISSSLAKNSRMSLALFSSPSWTM